MVITSFTPSRWTSDSTATSPQVLPSIGRATSVTPPAPTASFAAESRATSSTLAHEKYGSLCLTTHRLETRYSLPSRVTTGDRVTNTAPPAEVACTDTDWLSSIAGWKKPQPMEAVATAIPIPRMRVLARATPSSTILVFIFLINCLRMKCWRIRTTSGPLPLCQYWEHHR